MTQASIAHSYATPHTSDHRHATYKCDGKSDGPLEGVCQPGLREGHLLCVPEEGPNAPAARLSLVYALAGEMGMPCGLVKHCLNLCEMQDPQRTLTIPDEILTFMPHSHQGALATPRANCSWPISTFVAEKTVHLVRFCPGLPERP